MAELQRTLQVTEAVVGKNASATLSNDVLKVTLQQLEKPCTRKSGLDNDQVESRDWDADNSGVPTYPYRLINHYTRPSLE